MDPDKRKGIAAAATTMIGLPTLTIIFRCLAIYIVRKSKFGWDDYFAIADLPFIVGIAATTLAMVNFDEHHGAATWSHGGPSGGSTNGPPGNFTGGFPPSNMTNGFPPSNGTATGGGFPSGIPSDLPFTIPTQIADMVTAIQFLYVIGLTLPRLSIVFFYYRIFGKTHRWFVTALRIAGGVCVTWMLVNIIVSAVKCTPLRTQFTWTPLTPGNCINIQAYGISLLASSMVIDLALLILPMPLVFKIKAPLTKRISVALLFMVGSSVIVFTAGRLILTVQGGPFALSSGFMKGGPIASFIQLEAAMSLVSVSLPTIFTLFRHLFSKGKQSFTTSTSSAEHLRPNKSGHQEMSDYHRSIRSTHTASASTGTAKSGFKSPLVTATSISQSDVESSSPSRSGHEDDSTRGDILHAMPHQIMVKHEYHVSKEDYI